MWSVLLSPGASNPVALTSQAEPLVRAPGEARIGVRLAGVCDTDLQLARGYMGFDGVPGHEFVGQVLEADDPAWVGARVVGDINAGCGSCPDCLGQSLAGHHCQGRSVLGIVGRSGAFAEQLCLPERCLTRVPDSVSDEQAVFAEPLAAALHVLDEIPHGYNQRQAPGDPIVVLGDGKLGLLIALSLVGSGLHVRLVGHHAAKLELARRACGAEHQGKLHCLLESQLGVSEQSSIVVEATGSSAGLARAFTLVRPRGTVVLKTTVADPLSLDLAPLVIHELRLVGSRCGDMQRAVRALEQGVVDPTPLIEARYALRQAEAAFEHAARRGALKVLIAPD